jgi:hypothetical protein
MNKKFVHPVLSKYIFIISISFLLVSCAPLSPSQAIDKVSSRIVQIVFISQDTPDGRFTDTIVLGTGTIVNRDGYVITANHILGLGAEYIQQSKTPVNKLAIVIPPPDIVTNTGSSLSQQIVVNDFEVLDKDTIHDLALLKVKMEQFTSPLNGETISSVKYSNGTAGSLILGDSRLSKTIPINKDIAVSGYPIFDLKLETAPGRITSSNKLSLENAVLAESTAGMLSQNINDCYETNITSSPALSGCPAYIISNAAIIGIGINVIRDDTSSSPHIVIIPAEFIISLINRNNMDWGN